MDDEQFERHKEFMLRQQAQSAERMAQLEDLLVRFAQATRERFTLADQRAQEADQRAQEIDEKIAALIDAQIRADARMAEIDEGAKARSADLDRRVALLFDSQRKTEETVRELGRKIGNLTEVVERHIVEGHNGRARADG